LIKSLRSLQTKKGRGETGLFLAEGARLAGEAADLGFLPEILCLSESALQRAPVRALAERAMQGGAKVIETSESVLSQISRKDNPQTVVGAYRQNFATLDELVAPKRALYVALEGVRDPGNLGTIVRTADAVGAHGIILIGQTCDPFSVEAVRATMGSIFALQIARASFEAFEAWRLSADLLLVGTHLNGKDPPEAFDAERGLVLLMGNEQSGLDERMASACDALVRLPMKGRADSLNLSIATGVLLYDVWRRRQYDGARR
jgi:TrmH family RNA methyltransferase